MIFETQLAVFMALPITVVAAALVYGGRTIAAVRATAARRRTIHRLGRY